MIDRCIFCEMIIEVRLVNTSITPLSYNFVCVFVVETFKVYSHQISIYNAGLFVCF